MQNQSISTAAESRPEASGALSFALVGPGNVGTSLATALMSVGCHCVRVGDRGRPPRSGGPLTSVPRLRWRDLRSDDADLLLLCVADSALDEVAETLAERPQAATALHVSGRFDAEKIAPLRKAGCAVGTLHPLRAFTRPLSLDKLRGTWFAIDGDPEARRLAARLSENLGGHWAEIGGEARALYHLAATVAAGGVITLLAVVEELARVAGLPDAMLDAYLELTRGALAPLYDGARPVPPQITGPAARGDRQALVDQIRAVDGSAPHLRPLIETLQRETLRQCGHSDEPAVDGDEPGEIPPPSDGKRE